MFKDLLGAFTGLFTERRSRWEVSGLLLTMAMLPVSELLVTRMFSQLVLHGAERLEADRTAVIVAGGGFFLAFAVSRALHHVVRLNRVRVFRRGFESSKAERPAHQEAWSWAAAFELSTASVALIQVLAFSALFVWLDPVFGVLNVGIGAAVLGLVALIYRRQLIRQLAYLREERGATTGVGERVGRRLRDAELGAVLASLAMALALALVLLRAVTGALPGADAIVLFIGLRMMYSQIGHLSASAMRFARVKARLSAGSAGGGVEPDPDDGGEADDEDDATEARAEIDLPPAVQSPHRSRLVRQMLLTGQQGGLEEVREYGARLHATARPMEQETRAHEVAEAFALLAGPSEHDGAIPVTWWTRPFPGTVGNWMGPLLLRRLCGHPVSYAKPGVGTDLPHLVTAGSLLGSVQRSSVVIGAGALGPDVRPDPGALFLSVRGPLSAEALRRAGGPSVERYGDPIVLAPLVLPVPRPASNGRLALVRHVSQSGMPLALPEEMDELSPQVSRPPDVEMLVTTLAKYDGVVTTDPGVVALCHSYALPCAPIALEERGDLDFVLRDQALGLGIHDVPPARSVGLDLRGVRWQGLLETRTVEQEVRDRVRESIEQGAAHCLERTAPV